MTVALILQILQAALQYGPAAIQAAQDFYNTIRAAFSTTDQETINAAFNAAKLGDREATDKALADLAEAAKY